MHARMVITCLLSFPLVSGCCELGRAPETSVQLSSLVLRDVQGLYGGRSVWVDKDRAAVIQIVERPTVGRLGLWEKRYKVRLTAEQWAEAERLVAAHHFLTLKVPERWGVPDEARPRIVVVTTTGTTAKVAKWAGDKHPDFDPLYEFLLGVCRDANGQQPVHEGPFDWEWRPAGFERQ